MMAGFKDFIKLDLDTFINLNEFAEIHYIDDVPVKSIIDSDVLQIYSNVKAEQYDGVYRSVVALYVKEDDLGYRPVRDQHLNIDGAIYIVTECPAEMGILKVVLEVAES